MTFSELQIAARAMSPEAVAGNLKSMMEGDARFAAVLAWLEQNREGFVAVGCAQKMAKDAGVLAHCQGSVHAILTLEGQLREVLQPSGRRGPQGPPP